MTYKEAVKKLRLILLTMLSISLCSCNSLRIFLGLLSFRCNYRADQYINNTFDETTRRTLTPYAKDGNFADLWKREIEELSKLRSYDDLKNCESIDPIIRLDFEQLLLGFYMTIVDARGGQFLVTDVYPTLEICPIKNGTNLHLHFFYPISPNRMLVLNHIMFRKDIAYRIESDPFMSQVKKTSEIKGYLLKQPKHIPSHVGTYNMDDKYVL